jgi:hemerythrin
MEYKQNMKEAVEIWLTKKIKKNDSNTMGFARPKFETERLQNL